MSHGIRPPGKWNEVCVNMKTFKSPEALTHRGRVTHICVDNLTIIGSDNGLSPGGRQAIIWTNDEMLLIGPLGTNFSEILIAILTFSLKKMRLKVSSAKRRLFCLCLNVLKADKIFRLQCVYGVWVFYEPSLSFCNVT